MDDVIGMKYVIKQIKPSTGILYWKYENTYRSFYA